MSAAGNLAALAAALRCSRAEACCLAVVCAARAGTEALGPLVRRPLRKVARSPQRSTVLAGACSGLCSEAACFGASCWFVAPIDASAT